MSTADHAPEDNRILAMVFAHEAKMYAANNWEEIARLYRDYAKRFQPEPEKRFQINSHSNNCVYDTVESKNLVARDSTEAREFVILLNSLHAAAKGGKTT